MEKTLNIAVVGVGGFACFSVTEFIKISGVKLIGGFDENAKNAERIKDIDSTATVFSSFEKMLENKDVNLVYIATPPFLHYEQSKKALLAGKNVICEKPAATKLKDAIELKKLSEEKNLLYVVNLMQRYNPLVKQVEKLIKSNILGEFVHGFFENYASDENLGKDHWFWDEEKSGGIFIEHGVHFFDLFSGWLGEGKVISSQKMERQNNAGIWDKVQSVVQYGNAFVNFYHGFDQPKVLDRQEMRLLFEKGEITLYEWVPTRLKMNAICTDKELEFLEVVFPNAKIEVVEAAEDPKKCKGRFKEISYKYKISLDTGNDVQKQSLYQLLVSSMLKDQMEWLKNKAHIRTIDQNNAVTSLELAEISEKNALKIYSKN